MKRFPWWLIPAFSAVAGLLGCNGDTPRISDLRARRNASEAADADPVGRAMSFLESDHEFDPDQVISQATYYFDLWLKQQSVPKDFPDNNPLLAKLPKDVRIPPLDRLRDLRVEPLDARYVQEQTWFRHVSRWVPRGKPDSDLAAWLKEQEPKLGLGVTRQLAAAERLFDWTVRNIQLDPLLEFPVDQAGPSTDKKSGAAQSPVARGVPGPGYTEYPGATMLYGTGDAWQRARVFIHLLRQVKIPAAMLAFDKERVLPRPRPWIVGVLLGGQIYLFDPQLGLPVSAAKDRGIATLAEAIHEPAILENFSLGAKFPYTVSAEDWQRLVVLLDAAPEAMSVRMRLIEGRLTGEQGTVLYVDVAALADQFRACEGVRDVQLWTVPYEAYLFHSGRQKRLRENPRDNLAEFERVGMFHRFTPIRQARLLHFRGEFENRDERLGAKSRYLQGRVTKDQLENLESDRAIQMMFGVVRAPNEPEPMWKERLLRGTQSLVRLKHLSTYWIGVANLDAGQLELAREWLAKETQDGPWRASARLNLARVHEATGRLEDARTIYLRDDSPQQHGSLIRARRLRLKLEK